MEGKSLEEIMLSYVCLPESSYSTLMPYQVAQVRKILLGIFPKGTVSTIVDTTAHIGGDSILFADTFPNASIIAIDNDSAAIECLVKNTRIWQILTRPDQPPMFTIIQTDCVKWIRESGAHADFYYFDPPWGGPKYHNKKKIDDLYLEAPPSLDSDRVEIPTPIHVIINGCLDQGLTKTILLKAPRNFDYPTFKSKILGVCELWCIKKQTDVFEYAIIVIRR